MEMDVQSEKINEIATALSKAQGELKPAKKSCKSHFAEYADLKDIVESSREVLKNNGLSVSQSPFPGEDGKLLIVTTLMHSSGQWLRAYMPVIAHKLDNHTIASGITYAKRYSFASIVGIVQEGEDDDAKEAMGDEGKPGKSINAAPLKSKPNIPKKGLNKEISKIQFDELNSLINGHDDIRENLMRWLKNPPYNKEYLTQLPASVFEWVMNSCRVAIANKYKKQTEQFEEVKDVRIAAK